MPTLVRSIAFVLLLAPPFLPTGASAGCPPGCLSCRGCSTTPFEAWVSATGEAFRDLTHGVTAAVTNSGAFVGEEWASISDTFVVSGPPSGTRITFTASLRLRGNGYGALSCDHIEYLDAAGVAAMRGAGSTAVLLPGAFYALRETKAPPVAALREAGVPIALATDLNPGTSPLASLLLTMNLAATFFRLTVPECLAGTTREAARALGLAAETGTLEAGKSADFTVWQVTSPAELVYWIGLVPAHTRVFRGAPSC